MVWHTLQPQAPLRPAAAHAARARATRCIACGQVNAAASSVCDAPSSRAFLVERDTRQALTKLFNSPAQPHPQTQRASRAAVSAVAHSSGEAGRYQADGDASAGLLRRLQLFTDARASPPEATEQVPAWLRWWQYQGLAG